MGRRLDRIRPTRRDRATFSLPSPRRAPRPCSSTRRHRRDGGFTLPEVLIAMVLSGMIVAVVSTSISVMLRSTARAEVRIAESKDITFLGTWVPVDLTTSVLASTDADDAAVRATFAAGEPSMTWSATFPGTNVLTLAVEDASTGAVSIVSYRYVQADDGTWRIERHVVENPGTGSETHDMVPVAYEVAAPPDGWDPTQSPTHAVQVRARNQASQGSVGVDIGVTFASGNTIDVGGANLVAGYELGEPDLTQPDPTAPPSRCGGRVALVLDTSYSIPGYGGGASLEAASVGFLDAFSGTPTDVTVMGFDSIAYQLYPNLNGVRGEYFSLLDVSADSNGNGTSDVDEAKANIRALPDRDTRWPHGNGTYFEYPDDYYYGDRWATIGWTQIRTNEAGSNTFRYNGRNYYIWGGTNWEDALYAPFFTQTGTQRPLTPELVIWITDGEPNRQRADYFGGTPAADNVSAAVNAANAGRSTGARVVGVLVGPAEGDLESNLAAVVGTNKWNGTGPLDLGNAVAADYFAGSFSELGLVLRSIMASQCGGTVTVRKELTDGTSPGGTWTYTTETGSRPLDLDIAQAITFDFDFDGVITRDVTIQEEPKDGYSFVEGQCEVGGQPIDPARVVQQPDGIPGVQVTLKPDEAVSCVMVSARE